MHNILHNEQYTALIQTLLFGKQRIFHVYSISEFLNLIKDV